MKYKKNKTLWALKKYFIGKTFTITKSDDFNTDFAYFKFIKITINRTGSLYDFDIWLAVDTHQSFSGPALFPPSIDVRGKLSLILKAYFNTTGRFLDIAEYRRIRDGKL